jgi:hypothetical protein
LDYSTVATLRQTEITPYLREIECMRSPPKLKAETMKQLQIIINRHQLENIKRVSYSPCYAVVIGKKSKQCQN